MKRANIYLILLFLIVSGASILNSVVFTPNQFALVKDKMFLDREPTENDLFILKDSSNFKTIFKIKELKENGQNVVVFGNQKLDWEQYHMNISYLKKLISENQNFDLTNSQIKSTAELKALFSNGALENDAVYKIDKHPTPLFLQILSSYFGYLFLVILIFLIIWLMEFIWQLLNHFIKFPRHSQIYFFTGIGVFAFFQSVNNPLTFSHSGFALLFGLLAILPVSIAFNFVKNRKQNLSFSSRETLKFLVFWLVGISAHLFAFVVTDALYDIFISRKFRVEIMFVLGQAFLFWTAIGAGNFLNNFRKHFLNLRKQDAKLKTAQKNELTSQAELDALQARINPHFLYNSLNSIASLAQIDPAKTEAMAMALSKFYKYSTNRQDEHLSSILEEMEMLKTYLEIEKIRFGERLDFEIDYEKSALAWRIPRFLIQPIVENAIKHGYDKMENNIKILIEVKEAVDEISIAIFDNGKAFPENMKVGYGLRSVQKKLKLLFPERYELAFVNAPKKYVLIRIFQ